MTTRELEITGRPVSAAVGAAAESTEPDAGTDRWRPAQSS
jgi:hypothetical protein